MFMPVRFCRFTLRPAARRANRLAAALVLAAPFCLPLGAARAQNDTIRALVPTGSYGTSTTGTSSSDAYHINNAGQVAVDSQAYNDSHASQGYVGLLVGPDGSRTNLGSLGTSTNGGSNVRPKGVNNAASVTVVGSAATYDASHAFQGTEAFKWQNGTMTGLGFLSTAGTDSRGRPTSFAYGVNDAGTAAGWAQVYDSSHNSVGREAVLYQNGAVTDLGNLGTSSTGAVNSYGYNINNSGQIVGLSDVYDANHVAKGQAAFVSLNGQTTVIGNFGTDANGQGFSAAASINDAGQVAGGSEIYDANHVDHGSAAFIWQNGQMTRLGNLGTDANGNGSSTAQAINNVGQIIGSSDVYDANHTLLYNHPYFYSGGAMTDLYTLIGPNSGWTNLNPFGLNDSGQIVGYGTYQGSTQAFLIQSADQSAAPEASSVATVGLLALCLGALLLRARRRKAPKA